MRPLPLIVLIAVTASGALCGASAQETLDTSAVAQAIGKSGTAMPDGVYRATFPRSDLHVTIGDVPVAPGLALGSYAAFKAEPQGTLACW